MLTMAEANERIQTSFPWRFQSKWLYVGLAIYWLVAWSLPWESIGRWDWVPDAVDGMASLVPSIHGLPATMVHFMSKSAIEAQLAFLHLSGLLFTLVVLIFTRPMLIKPKVKRKRFRVFMGVISSGFLLMFLTIIAHYAYGFKDGAKIFEVFHDTDFNMVLFYVFAYWVYGYLFSFFLSFAYALFLPLEIKGEPK